MNEIPVDLTATGGRLVLPTAGPPGPPPPGPAPAAAGASGSAPNGPAASTDPVPHVHAPGAERCRLCGWNQGTDPFEPDPGDAQAFRDAVFDGKPYTKTVTLFGSARVTFRDLPPWADEAARVATIKAARAEEAVDRVQVAMILNGFVMGLAVTGIDAGARTYRALEGGPEELHAAVREWCGSDTLYRAVRGAHSRFQAQLQALTARAHDPSFFEATGSGGGSPASRPGT